MSAPGPEALSKLARERLVRLTTAFEMLCGALEVARDAIDQAIKDVEEERDALLKACETALIGHCMACEQMLLGGDIGYRDGEQVLFCCACAPTWRELGDCVEEIFDEPVDQAVRSAFAARRSAYIASGGALDDPVGERL